MTNSPDGDGSHSRCKAQETAYKITGTVPASVSKVYLYVMGQRAALDSATVSNGKFELSGKQNLNEIFMLDANNEAWHSSMTEHLWT